MIFMVGEQKAGDKADDGREQLADFLKDRKQSEFAKRVRCSPSHLSLILSKKRGMSYGLAKRVSAATGISVDSLMSEVAQ